MHELSIANYLVETVLQQIADQPNCLVQVVHLRVGELSGVHRDSLLFSFDLVTEGTPLAGARLEIETVPVTVFCSLCDLAVPLDGIQSFRCPNCQTPSADIRSGRELELHSLEIADVSSTDFPEEQVIK